MNKKGPAATSNNKPTTATSTKGGGEAAKQPVPQVPPIDLNPTPKNTVPGKIIGFNEFTDGTKSGGTTPLPGSTPINQTGKTPSTATNTAKTAVGKDGKTLSNTPSQANLNQTKTALGN
jgi:hypothetical protein